jgi:hypothetical protein
MATKLTGIGQISLQDGALATNVTIGGEFHTLVIGEGGESTHFGELSQAQGVFTIPGDAQFCRTVVRAQTGDATPTDLALDGGALYFAIPENTAYNVMAEVVAKEAASINSATWLIEGGVVRDVGLSAQTIGTPINAKRSTGTGTTASWTASLIADTASSTLRIRVTGAGGVQIQWVATLHLTKTTTP